jgi:hypothetical protein
MGGACLYAQNMISRFFHNGSSAVDPLKDRLKGGRVDEWKGGRVEGLGKNESFAPLPLTL